MFSFSSQARVLCRFCRSVSYIQGQSPTPKTREYFYYIDHQGQVWHLKLSVILANYYFCHVNLQLFLDDTKVKNFITCFKGGLCYFYACNAELALTFFGVCVYT